MALISRIGGIVLAALLITTTAPQCMGQGASPTKKSPEAVPQGALRLEVVVQWRGKIPAGKDVVISPRFRARNPEDATFCDQCRESGKLFDESLVIDKETRGIRDVAVLLAGLPAGKASKTTSDQPALKPAMIDNRGCRFSPRVQWAPIGKPITIKNSDPFIHNARILGRGQRQWWNGLVPAKESVETHPMTAGGVYSIVCDVHPWMKSWVIGTSNPWVGITNSAGKQVWSKVASSKPLTAHLWHPTLGRAKKVISNLEANSKTPAGVRVLQLVFSEKDFQR